MLINYSVISLVPCLVRDEHINVGVVTWAALPTHASVERTASSPVAVRMVNSLDETVLGRALPEPMRTNYTRAIGDLKKRLDGKSGDDVTIMSAHMNNLLQLTPPRRMSSTSGDLVAEADELFSTMVWRVAHHTVVDI